MYPVSSDFLKAIKSTQRSFVLKLEIDTAFDTFYLTEKDVDMGSLKLEEGCVSGDSLELGAAKAALFDISINNRDGRFDDVQFNGGIMKPFIGLELPNGNIEWVPLGVFNIDEVSRPTTSVSLGGSDNLILFDRDFADIPVSFPTTNKQLLLAICNRVGVPLATTNFLNDDYVVQKAPDSAMSCRDVVKCIAELAAGFAQCDRTTGALKIVPFQNPGCVHEANIDGGDFIGIDHTASGTTVEYDGPFGTKITSIVVTGKTTQEGTGDPSPDNVRTIYGASKVTVNGIDYAFPLTLYSLPNGVADTFDVVSGTGIQKVKSRTFSGTESWQFGARGWSYGNTVPFYCYLNDEKINGTSICDTFPTVSNNVSTDTESWMLGYSNFSAIRILKSRLNGWDDNLSDAEKAALFKAWLTAHPVTVIYELASPVEITGTPQRILTEGHTVITNDADAQMQVGYNTMTGDDVDGGDFTWYNTKTTDGGAFVMPDPVVELGPSNRFDFKIDDNPVTITGIVYEAKDQDYVIGDRTYALHISDNVLIQGDPTDVLNKIADAMIGFTYLPFTSSWQGNPALQPGDIIQQTDRKGVQYRTIVTNSTYAYRGVCNLSAKGASEIAHSYQSKQTKKATQLLRLIHEKEVKIDSLSQAILNATNLISGALGGHWINGDDLPDEKYHGNVFIADNEDITKAKKVWRWNLGGFGHSNNGVDGPYTAAITADDSIVANIITASMIKTGRLQSIANPNVYFDLDEGVLCASRLVSSENGSKDVYAKIGTVSWADGTTSKGLSLNSAEGILAYFNQREADGATDHGLEITSPGRLHIRSDTDARTQNNVLQMYNNSNHQGNIVFRRATGKGSTEHVFVAMEGYTEISHNGWAIAIDDTGPYCSNGATGDYEVRLANGGTYTLHLRGGFAMDG